MKQGGVIGLSLDKNRQETIDFGSRKIRVYPDDAEKIAAEAIALLTEAIETPEKHVPRQITVEGTLVEGDTVLNRPVAEAR